MGISGWTRGSLENKKITFSCSLEDRTSVLSKSLPKNNSLRSTKEFRKGEKKSNHRLEKAEKRSVKRHFDGKESAFRDFPFSLTPEKRRLIHKLERL